MIDVETIDIFDEDYYIDMDIKGEDIYLNYNEFKELCKLKNVK